MNMPKESIHLAPLPTHARLLINNKDRPGEGELLQVVNPATEELVAEFAGASVAQVEAVACAKAGEDGLREFLLPQHIDCPLN